MRKNPGAVVTAPGFLSALVLILVLLVLVAILALILLILVLVTVLIVIHVVNPPESIAAFCRWGSLPDFLRFILGSEEKTCEKSRGDGGSDPSGGGFQSAGEDA